MDPLTLMIISSVLPTIFGMYSTRKQQDREFDQQQQFLNEEQDFTREREDLAYQRSLPSTQMQNMLDAGFNENLAANAVLGGNGQSVSASGSPQAPTVSSAIGALQSMIGQGGQNLYDSMLKQAEIENMQANTNKTEVEAGLLPRDYELRKLSTEAQIRVWNQSVHKMAAEVGLTQEQTRLVEQQNMYYGRKSEAEINAMEAKVAEAVTHAMLQLEQIDTEKAKQSDLHTHAGLNVALTGQSHAETELAWSEQSTEYYKSERERIAKEFEQKLGNIPLTADAQRYVESLIKDGKMKEVQQFYTNIFTAALNQSIGNSAGEFIGKPNQKVGIFGEYSFGVGKHENFYSPYAVPYWNPH